MNPSEELVFAKKTQVPELYAEPIERGDRLQLTTALRAAQAWRPSGSKLLVLAGNVGTGKSLAAAWAVHDWWVDSRNPPYPEGKFWVSAASMARMVRLKRLKTYAEAVADLERPAMLVLDDLGEEVNTTHTVAAISSLITSRIAHNRDTIITTVCDQDTFVERYGERVIDLLRGCGLKSGKARWWVRCPGVSLRGRVEPEH